MDSQVSVYIGEQLARYGFEDGHPFSRQRHGAFCEHLRQQHWFARVHLKEPTCASVDELAYFHTHDYIQQVQQASITGSGYLDGGDTPAFVGAFEAARTVVGSTLDAVRQAMTSQATKAFVPIAGLHHARPDQAGGFCIFNDCAIAALALRDEFGLSRVAYVDIDAHHGDGVYYGLESEAFLIFADIHEDGRFLYPGTGRRDEVGVGDAAGTKLNLPLAPGTEDSEFREAWSEVEAHLRRFSPEFILLQCGADSVAGDPLTHLALSPQAHGYAAKRLVLLAEEFGHGRVVATGGGGYNLNNVALAWTAVVENLLSPAA